MEKNDGNQQNFSGSWSYVSNSKLNLMESEFNHFFLREKKNILISALFDSTVWAVYVGKSSVLVTFPNTQTILDQTKEKRIIAEWDSVSIT